MATLPFPAKIGKYDVLGVIGRGGMGVVYQAKDPHLDRRVAIKMITGAFSENTDMLKRFFREAQSLASLQHPNIVTVFDLGDLQGTPYFVMEYLEGEGLDSVLANRRPLNLLEKISIITQVCNGLGYAHRRGVIHRDIKPANIMICKDGSIKIFDFGIAHAGHTTVTRTGEVLGTLRYMAPEQVNSKSTDSRTDIFSTGVVLYQLITDHLPFDGDNTASTLMKIVSEPPPPLGTFLSVFPPEMEDVLLRALAKNPNDRYTTAEDFAMDLSQLQGQLKDEMIGQEMNEVAALLDHGEVYKAQNSLLRVLKLDSHHTRANRMLRDVQQRIQRDELSKQVQALKESAEEALTDQQFDKALDQVDRALCLDRNNTDLQHFREHICAEAARIEKLHKALKAAETAQTVGNLDAAREAAEEALALAPNDTQARMLYRMITREIEERARHQQMVGYLDEARREISSRHFTAAIEILKHAEELEPGTPQIHTLMESAVAGQEQERRRKELDALAHEVEEALNRDDYRTACSKIDQGLTRFPEDRNLLKLKSLADRQRQIEERRQLIDALMAESRNLLQTGRHEELRDKLERALAQLGPDARLESLLGVVKERLHREAMERIRAQRLADARSFIEDRSYDHAIRTLEAAISESGDDEEVRQLLSRARAEQTEAVTSALAQAEQESVLARRVEILEDALNMSPQEMRVREALHQARNLNQVISKIAVEAQRLEEERKYDQALAKWETVSAVYQHYPRLKEIVKRLHDLRDHAQASAHQGWIDKVERALSAGEFDQAAAIAIKAGEEFPWDTDLMALQERAENGARSRAKALKLLAEGRIALSRQQWDAGSQAIVRAFQAAPGDTMIRDQAISELAQASRATVDNNWQASELILNRLAEIEPSATGSRDLQTIIETRKKEDTINSALNAARRQQANGNLQGALRELDAAFAAYANDKRLLDLRMQLEQKIEQAAETARLEEQRRKKDAFVQNALGRAQQTPDLEARAAILEEALNTEPQEARLRQQLQATRDLRTRVTALAAEAQSFEQRRDFEQALARWETIGTIHRDYPEIGRILEQARQRHQQALLEAKANCMRGVQQALSSSDYKRAEELIAQAKRVFPADRELAELERRVREGIANRAQAEKILESAAKAAAREKWRKALETYQEASAIAKTDAVIREHVVNGLLGAAEVALGKDSDSAELMIAEAARLEPGSPMLTAVRARMDAGKRAQATDQCLAAAQKCAATGDWQGALRALDRGLATYPNEQRLLERRARMETEMRRRAEELATREAHEKETREKARHDEEQRLAREKLEKERLAQQKAAEAQAARESAAEQERARQRVRAEEEERRQAAQSAVKPAIPAPAQPQELSATQIFVRGTAQTAPLAASPIASAANESEWPTAAPPLPPSAEKPAAPTKPEPPRDKTIAAKADSPTAAARSQTTQTHPTNGEAFAATPGAGSDEITESSLQAVERRLAAFIGPLAKILVKRESSKTKSLAELYAILAARIERDEDRAAFLAKRTEPGSGKAANAAFTKLTPASAPAPAPQPVDAASPGEITAAAIDLAARKLAAYLGPIGPLVAKKEARRAANLREFYELLAEHIDAKDRERFLKEAGIVNEPPPATGFLRRPDGTAFFTQPGDRTSAQTKPAAGPERKA